MKTHFKEFKGCKEIWEILDADLSNFDKTGFQIGVLSRETVVVPVNAM